MKMNTLNDLAPQKLLRLATTGFFTILAGTGCIEKKVDTPNILFILMDDHAAQAVSAYGSHINSTPNIDRIALEGALFTNCFCTNSICAPSRAVILTGKYSHINGVKDNLTSRFDGSQETFPKLLQQANYETAIFGKWHLKSNPTGFNHWDILPGQGEYHDPVLIENGVKKKHKGYVTDIITDKALNWLKNRKEEKPFCLLVHHKAVHGNWETDEKHADMYENVKIPEPSNFHEDYQSRVPQLSNYKLGVGPYQWNLHYKYRFGEMPVEGNEQEVDSWMYQRYIKDYLKCVASVDDNVGRILDYLDETGLSDNTIVVYTSDQGFFLGEHGLYDKRLMYEESLRMPLMIRYPKEIKPSSVVDEMVLNLDFAETILDYAGCEVPEDMQGKSFRLLAQGKTEPEWRSAMYYRFYEEEYGLRQLEGIRTNRYKLIHYLADGEGWELFDLKKDPAEMKNLIDAEEYRDQLKSLKNKLAKLKKKYNDAEIKIGE
jgi:arylsulfatase A-like enzyme